MARIKEKMWIICIFFFGLALLLACFVIAAWYDTREWWRGNSGE